MYCIIQENRLVYFRCHIESIENLFRRMTENIVESSATASFIFVAETLSNKSLVPSARYRFYFFWKLRFDTLPL